jgi:hypothetical protein
MQHCGGGPGDSPEALREINAAVQRWVEEGVAPSLIPTRKRALCPYPQEACK